MNHIIYYIKKILLYLKLLFIRNKKIVILFDEYPTPNLGENRESDNFIGVIVIYNLSDEKRIFKASESLFGLKKSQPKKNRQISNETAVQIATLLCNLPLYIIVCSINLTNEDLRQTTLAYEAFGNLARDTYRNAKPRPVAQIFHSNMLDNCMFTAFRSHLEDKQNPECIYYLYMDNWSISNTDVEIYLINRSKSFEKKVNEVYKELGQKSNIVVRTLKLLKIDSKRKRFIDVVTTVCSRSFFNLDHPRYSCEIIELLQQNCSHFAVNDITVQIRVFMQHFMDAHRNMIL